MATKPSRAWHRAVCALAMAMAAALTVLTCEWPAAAATQAPPPHSRQADKIRDIRFTQSASEKASGGKKPAAARPSRIEIPSIGVAVPLMALCGPSATGGAGSTLSLPVPPLTEAAAEAGWYQFTAVPGAEGNAVIVGHVDTYLGAGVFYNLYLLHRGDPIYVSTGAGRQRFDVTSIREMPKPSFPVNQVFGASRKHSLWLITCGGDFDYETRHYLDNIVVSATWVPAPQPAHTRSLKAVNWPAAGPKGNERRLPAVTKKAHAQI
jgi:LPXTG-site transpeptidase (sortase) family protein